MPRYRVTDPTGAVYVVDTPEGATEQEAIAYVQQNVKPDPRAVKGNVAPPSLLERAIGGINDIATGAKQRYLMATDPAAAKTYTEGLNRDRGVYQQGMAEGLKQEQAGGPSWRDVARYLPQTQAIEAATSFRHDVPNALGQAVALAPTALIGGAPAAAGMAAGAAGGFLQPTAAPSWMDVGVNTLGAAATGGVLSHLGAKLTSPRSTPLSPEQQARVDAMRAVGIDTPPLPAVTGKPQDWYRMAELGKREGAAKEAYAGSLKDTSGKLTGAIEGMRSGPPLTGYEASESARGAVQQFAKESQKEVGAMYDAARAAAGAGTEVPMQPIADRIGKIADEFGVENLPAAVISRARQYGLLQGQQTKSFNVAEAEQFRKFLGNNLGPYGSPQFAAVRQLQHSVDDSVDALAGQAGGAAGEAFRVARAAAKTRFQTLDPSPIARLANVDETNPNFLRNLFTNGKPQEIAALNQLLQRTSPEAATALRDSMLQYIREAATPAATGQFSGAALKKVLERIGPERLRAVLTPQDMGMLANLQTAAQALTVPPVGAGINYSNTASSIGNMLRRLRPGAVGGAGLGHAVGNATGIPFAGEMIGAGIGAAGEAAGRGSAARQMQRLLAPDLERLNGLPRTGLFGLRQ